MSAAPTRAEGGRPDLAALDAQVEAARLALEESDRQLRQTKRRLIAMFIDIGARACAFNGSLWLIAIVPWVPKAEHAEALAEVSASLAAAACLWRWADRLCPHPWRDEPAPAAPREEG